MALNKDRAKKYSAVKTRFFIADLAVTIISLALFQVFLSRLVSNFAFDFFANFYAACIVYVIILLTFMYAVSLPFTFASSYMVEHSFGLSKENFGSWIIDEAKSAVLSLLLSSGAILVFYVILRNFPNTWWIIASVSWIFFTIILARFLPVLLIPLFFKYSPLEDASLKDRIMALADNAKIYLLDVCQIDFSRKTSKANAALVGLGKTRKVILADTLLGTFTAKEIETVVAHEFGHYKYRHMWQLLAFSGVLTLSGLFILSLAAEKLVIITGASGISDLYLLPVFFLMLLISGIILMPWQNLFSRILERQADRYALNITKDPETLVSVMSKLGEQNLADTDPSHIKKIFLYDHPPISERIKMAQDWKGDGR